MDTEKAKFILSSFRSEGQDAHDETFAEALSLAAENRELGDWLANERAQDTTFTSALDSISPPADLKDSILASLSPDFSSVSDPELDEAFINALEEITPPAGLREQILHTLDQNQKVVKNVFPIWKVLPFAAAAVVAICVFTLADFSGSGGAVADKPTPTQPDTVAPISVDVLPTPVDKVNILTVQVDAVHEIETSEIQLVSNSIEQSMDWLKARELPVAKVPNALQEMTCLGVSEFNLSGGARGSIIQFETDAGERVNMLVMANNEISNSSSVPAMDKVSKEDVSFCPACKYWLARMKQKESVVIVLSEDNKGLVENIITE